MVIFFAFSLCACNGLFENPDEDDEKPPVKEPDHVIKYAKEYWGEWLRMDTGDTWYISSDSIKVNNALNSADVSFVKQSARVAEVTEGSRKYYLYASRTTNSQFSGKIAGFDSGSRNTSRAAGSGLGGINIVISNLNNKDETATLTTDGEGKFTAEEVIAGDEYAITAEGQTTVVLPNANGDDIGTITVTDGVNFKTIIKPKYTTLTDMNRLCANFTSYNLNIEIENTGTEDCIAALYDLVFDDGLIIKSSVTTGDVSSGILGTIEPGKKRIIELSLACNALDNENEFEFKKIGITIDDPISGKSWDDSVSIKFYKASADFYIRSNSPISGVVITPSANTYSFKTTKGLLDAIYAASLTMPWSADDYLVVFSGATADTEAVYSLGINVIPDTDFADFRDVANYESNNTEAEAVAVNAQNKIMSYLHKNDIDYFKINLGTTAPEIKPVSITAQAIKNSNGSYYSNDAEANPGETHYLDIRVKNNTNIDFYIASITLSTASVYVTIDNDTAVIGKLGAGYYKTLTDSTPSNLSTYSLSDYGGSNESYLNLLDSLNSLNLARSFKFTIASDCPVGTQLPFTVTFTDSLGNVWTDTLTILVQ